MGRKTTLVENKLVYFDELTHTYLRSGDDKELMGVTTLMKLCGLGPDYKDIPQAVLEKAAERGSAVHKAIECHCKGETYDIPFEYQDEVILDMAAYKLKAAAEKFKVLANEYLVSDNEYVASSIDMILNDLTLIDIKTTSEVHTDAVSWQLSIYKYLFELQNPGRKVPHLKCLHIRKGVCKLVDIPEKPREQVVALMESFKNGEIWQRVREASLPKVSEEQKEIVRNLEELERRVVGLKAQLKELEAQQASQKEAVMEFMVANSLKKWEVSDNLTFTYVEPTTRKSLDSKRLQAEYPELYEDYLKESEVKASLRITIK